MGGLGRSDSNQSYYPKSGFEKFDVNWFGSVDNDNAEI